MEDLASTTGTLRLLKEEKIKSRGWWITVPKCRFTMSSIKERPQWRLTKAKWRHKVARQKENRSRRRKTPADLNEELIDIIDWRNFASAFGRTCINWSSALPPCLIGAALLMLLGRDSPIRRIRRMIPTWLTTMMTVGSRTQQRLTLRMCIFPAGITETAKRLRRDKIDFRGKKCWTWINSSLSNEGLNHINFLKKHVKRRWSGNDNAHIYTYLGHLLTTYLHSGMYRNPDGSIQEYTTVQMARRHSLPNRRKEPTPRWGYRGRLAGWPGTSFVRLSTIELQHITSSRFETGIPNSRWLKTTMQVWLAL